MWNVCVQCAIRSPATSSVDAYRVTYLQNVSAVGLMVKIHYTSFPVTSLYNKLARANVRCVCCVVSQIQLQQLVANKLATIW